MNKLASVERVSNSILRVLALNPGPFTLQGTNTYLIGSGKKRVLIDTGDGEKPDYFKLLKENLGACRISTILLTHWHGDHVGGVEKIISDPELSSSDCQVYKCHSLDADNNSGGSNIFTLNLKDRKVLRIEDSQVFDVDKDVKIMAVFTPGHTDDHMAFVIDNIEDVMDGPILFSGDLILGQGTTIVHDLTTYMDSLNHVLRLEPKFILPGHGPVVQGVDPDSGKHNAAKVIEGYIEHRNLRERQILDVLAQKEKNGSLGWWTVSEITSIVYKDLSDPRLIIAAGNNVKLHLGKLLKQDLISTKNGRGGELWALVKSQKGQL